MTYIYMYNADNENLSDCVTLIANAKKQQIPFKLRHNHSISIEAIFD